MITILLVLGIIVDVVVFIYIMELKHIPTKYAIAVIWLIYTLFIVWCISKYIFIYLNGGLLW